MSYDPYNDPYNPVAPRDSDVKDDLGTGNGGGDFTYGAKSRDIQIRPAAEGVAEGTTDAQTWVSKWDPHGPNGGSYDTSPFDVADGD